MLIRTEWDEQKAASNLVKHGVSFEVAALAFADPLALSVQDRLENGERRWQTLGMAGEHMLLLVAHSVDEDEDGEERIGIISARKADKKDRKRHEQNR